MQRNLMYALAALVVVAIVAIVAFAGPTIATSLSPTPTATPRAGIANPASVYCTERGYTLEIRNTANGQVGYCVFPDKSECEEWAFFRGQCGVRWQTPTK